MTESRPQQAARAPRLCVLIDADNVPVRHAESIFREIARLGEASVRRVYGDWTADRLRKWHDKASAMGLVPDQQSSNTKGKNASDIGLVISAMDYLHSGLFDGFVLVSSDSDFTRLAARIREQGIDVYGIGEQKTPSAFRNVCNRFIYIENIDAEEAPADPAAPERAPAQPARDKAPAKDAIPLIVEAMRAIGEDEDWVSLGQIGQFISQAQPDFDTRSYGSAKLSDLIRKTGRFEIRKASGNHWEVRDLA
ncbi:NYN domain-containing protein [Acidimangrovimonas sediminis]|uniref:NYN domain-containing protein n=1 Tax=Acidimangrovimonas sediminis TaxID=2056283 RepID=UPI000C80158E|nr:NYN domain-containing protein [Acidimangrovimonas sediminis]